MTTTETDSFYSLNPRASFAFVLLIHVLLGLFFAGSGFIKNMSTAVPRGAAGGSDTPAYMIPGDQFEQLYRYSLPRHNIQNGKSPYYSGAQYNFSADSKPFYEGWVFFPFSALHGLISLFIGDIAAYNLISCLSFPMVGGAMFLLVAFLTRSFSAAFLSSLILALLPHRTSFLFGEMVYGVDLMWPPLIILCFEKSVRSFKARHAIFFGAMTFLYTTSNIQGFYLFSIFSLPYFISRSFLALRDNTFSLAAKIRQAVTLLFVLMPSFFYMRYLHKIISASGISSGQSYSETTFYSPTLIHLITRWSGNEKTIYLGFVLLIFTMFLLYYGVSSFLRKIGNQYGLDAQITIIFIGVSFALGYLFCFGPNLDTMLKINLYRWYFDYFPGANSTRSPGRAIGAVAFHFSLLFGYAIAIISTELAARHKSRMLTAVIVAIAFVIINDYHYTKPLMVMLEHENAAYNSVRGVNGIVFTAPNNRAAAHYHNATFLFFAQRYNLKIFSGHSSMYPKEWNEIIDNFLPINAGKFDRTMMNRFQMRGFTHLIVHATPYEPKVSPVTLEFLKKSPFLKLLAEDKGIASFEVDYFATGDQRFDEETLSSILSIAKFDEQSYGDFLYLDGWYGREAYPNQPAFRWMHGLNSRGVILLSDKNPKHIEVTYNCPVEPLSIHINKKQVNSPAIPADGNWKKIRINLADFGTNAFIFDFESLTLFKTPTDSRNFGCCIREINYKQSP